MAVSLCCEWLGGGGETGYIVMTIFVKIPTLRIQIRTYPNYFCGSGPEILRYLEPVACNTRLNDYLTYPGGGV